MTSCLFELSTQTVYAAVQSMNKTEARKQAIMSAFRRFLTQGEIHEMVHRTHVDCFIKDEGYDAPSSGPAKCPRLICARDDLGKALYCPLFRPIEAAFFTLPFTVKHVPLADRPAYIERWMPPAPECVYFSLDYSSYESCQTDIHMRLMEHAVVSMAYNGDPRVEFMLDELRAGTDLCVRRDRFRSEGVSRVRAPCMRFSGEMDTSLGNTINNAVMIMTVLASLGEDPLAFVAEGDDALVRLHA